MKKYWYLFLMLVLIISFVGCSSKEKVQDQVNSVATSNKSKTKSTKYRIGKTIIEGEFSKKVSNNVYAFVNNDEEYRKRIRDFYCLKTLDNTDIPYRGVVTTTNHGKYIVVNELDEKLEQNVHHLMDENGSEINLGKKYDNIYVYKDKIIARELRKYNKPWVYDLLDISGEFICTIPDVIGSVGFIEKDGFVAFINSKKEDGIMDFNLNIIKNFGELDIHNIHSAGLICKNSEGKYALADTRGNLLTEYEYESIGKDDVGDGHIIVTKANKKKAILNSMGKEIGTSDYVEIIHTNANTFATLRENSKTVEILNSNGDILLAKDESELNIFAKLITRGKYTIISSGKFSYEFWIDGKKSNILGEGNDTYTTEYMFLDDEKYISFKYKSDTYGVVDLNGNIVLDNLPNKVIFFDDNLKICAIDTVGLVELIEQ